MRICAYQAIYRGSRYSWSTALKHAPGWAVCCTVAHQLEIRSSRIHKSNLGDCTGFLSPWQRSPRATTCWDSGLLGRASQPDKMCTAPCCARHKLSAPTIVSSGICRMGTPHNITVIRDKKKNIYNERIHYEVLEENPIAKKINVSHSHL